MDGTVVAAVAALAGTVVTGFAAAYGSRQASRAQREGGAITGYQTLTDELQEERRDLKEERRDLKTEVAALRAELAAKDAEIARLRLLVQQLGGTP